MSSLCGAFQCVLMHAVVHFTASKAKAGCIHIICFFLVACARHMGAWGGPLSCLHCVVHFTAF